MEITNNSTSASAFTGRFRSFAKGLFAAGFLYILLPLCLDWNEPIISETAHAFRQTQTAITVKSMLQGGPWLGYETPVTGSPWKIPFEFPLFQWIVAVVYRLLPLSLDQAGCLVNWTGTLLTLWPLRLIVRRLGGDDVLFYIFGALLLFSPVYAFWSHSFMIESTALLLSVGFIALLLRYLDKPDVPVFMLIAIVASLAALVKITTFLAFGVAGGILILRDYRARYSNTSWKTLAVRYGGIGCIGIMSLLLLLAWTRYCDHLKSPGILSNSLTSHAVEDFVFGSWSELFSGEFWTIMKIRMIPQAIGISGLIWSVAFIVLWGILLRRSAQPPYKSAVLSCILLGLFLLPAIIFTNLHFIHPYYQYENAIFLIGATAVLLWELLKGRPAFLSAYIVAMVIVGQILCGVYWFFPILIEDKFSARTYRIARFIREHTPRDSVIMAVGMDWSPIIPYYADRRAVMIPDWITTPELESILASPGTISGNLPIDAFVDCPHSGLVDPQRKNLVARLEKILTVGMPMQPFGSCKVFYRP